MPAVSDGLDGEARTARGNDIDYHSPAALVVFFFLCFLFWSCCCGWQFQCLPACLQSPPELQGCVTRAYKARRLWWYAILTIAVWVLVGTLFYHFHNEWTVAQSF